MTRQEFDLAFAVRIDQTEGFNAAQIAILNEDTFQNVEHIDADDRIARSAVNDALEYAAKSFKVVDAG
jgi:hypothetical protein